MRAQPAGEYRIFDVDGRAVSGDGYPPAAAGPLVQSHSAQTLSAAPASHGASLPVSAALEPKPAQRPLPRGEESTAAVSSPRASLGDVLFDQAMLHRALPRFELHELPAASVGTAAGSFQQAPGPARAGSIAGSHPGAEAPALSRAEVVRVADQVERLLKQRERFERERRGGL